MKITKVTCGVIRINDKILAVQRGKGMDLPLKWEFPGGKIEDGESEEDCLVREIHEELNIKVRLLNRLTASVYAYPNITIELIPYLADYVSGDLELREHEQYVFLDKDKLSSLDWAEADLPIVEELIGLDFI